MTVAAVVLAAGGSSRLGEPKQLLCDSHGETLVHMAAREACEAGAAPVLVVIGANAAAVADAVRDLPVTVVLNEDWHTGLSSSIKSGVAVIADMAGADALLLLTCDMPAVGVTHLNELLVAFTAGAVRVASSYGDTVGIPAVVPRSEFDELLQLSGDKGAKLLLSRDDTQLIALRNGAFDLDTPDDVAAWRAEMVRRSLF